MLTNALPFSHVQRRRARPDYAATVALLLMTLIFAAALAGVAVHPPVGGDDTMTITGP